MLLYQVKSVTSNGCLLFYSKNLPKVKNILSMAVLHDVDFQLNVIEYQPHQKPKSLELINTKTYRDLGIMGQKCPMEAVS